MAGLLLPLMIAATSAVVDRVRARRPLLLHAWERIAGVTYPGPEVFPPAASNRPVSASNLGAVGDLKFSASRFKVRHPVTSCGLLA